MKAGQQWKMTLQNAGEGFYGYLDSPSGQNLPAPSGNTPGGAQFRLMTQAEINAQPAWLLATETKIGTAIVLVGLAIATGGTADAGLEVYKVVGKTVKDTEYFAQIDLSTSVEGFMNEDDDFVANEEVKTDLIEDKNTIFDLDDYDQLRPSYISQVGQDQIDLMSQERFFGR